MKIMLAALFAAAAIAQAVPAPAASGYEVVKGYGYPPVVVAGPFDTQTECNSFMTSNGMFSPYHCQYVSY